MKIDVDAALIRSLDKDMQKELWEILREVLDMETSLMKRCEITIDIKSLDDEARNGKTTKKTPPRIAETFNE